MKLVECIPNFSEGRRKEVVDAILDEIRSVDGVKLLDMEMDADHNRSVVTFIGEPEAVKEAAFRATGKAAKLIDMDQHRGEHPRMGATDVIPFVPISDIKMDECVGIAKEVGERIGSELKIPVYLYEEAATRPDRVNLADVRRGQYEGLKEEIGKNPDKKPDFGPENIGKAGATAVGARMPLVAFNVYLGTDDIKIAKAIAKAVRHSSGGLRFVKAMGFEIKERGLVQVSMNLTNYKKTPIHRVFEMVKSEALRFGVNVVEGEIVGLVPEDALLDSAKFYLRLNNFKKMQVLEKKMGVEE